MRTFAAEMIYTKRKMLGFFLGFVIMTLVTVQTANAQTRIAVISDIHVMGKGLVVNDGTAWQKTLASDRKMLDKSRDIFDRLVSQFKTQRPDLLLVTGDLTKDGERLSHQYVKAGLDRLKAAGVKVFVIPGNHDLGTTEARIYDGDHSELAETLDEDGFRTMYADYGYDNGMVADSTSLSYACEPVPGLTLIGIDSHSGWLSEVTLDWVCRQAKDAIGKGRKVIAMMHHLLFPHFNGTDLFINTATINHYEYVRNRLADAGIRVILTGHFHTSDIAKDWNGDLSREIYDINTGSAISYPCDYRLLTLNRDVTELKVTTGHIKALPGDVNFAKTAKIRLQASMYNKACQKLGSRFSFSEEMKKQLADIAARTFIIHAEGNEGSLEHAQAVEQVRADISRFGSSGHMLMEMAMKILQPILESILTDTSNYGDPDREDCTDDLTLSIQMIP
jgi:predicted phosphodiesterase